jgi:lipoyl(octanoyl) transferase
MNDCLYKEMGRIDFDLCWEEMKQFTSRRTNDSQDEIWLVEHNHIYTQGLNGKDENILKENNIPIKKIDRGGQVTYHGPGQLIFYFMVDIFRMNLSVSNFIVALENVIINTLAGFDIESFGNRSAPGVYVENKKVASIGVRIKKGRSYHGLALNFNNDLAPFDDIHTCGIPGLEVTSISKINKTIERLTLIDSMLSSAQREFGYRSIKSLN